MPKLQTSTTNWTAGEFSPRLRGRSDIEKYNASAELLRNVVVLKQGGVTLRPPLDFIGEIKTSSETARPIPFIYSRTDAYILVFGHQTMQVIRNGAYVETSPGVRYEIATPYGQTHLAALDFAQGADTMIMTHGSFYPRRLRRFDHDRWVFDLVPFRPAAMTETGHRADITMTLSAATVGAGRTLTAASQFFVDADVGRLFTAAGGIAEVTAVASDVSATVTITGAFAGTSLAGNTWLLEGTPQTPIDPSESTPIGKALTLTASTGCWRVADIGKHVTVHSGLVKITSATHNGTIANAVIVNVLASDEIAPTDSWVLKGDTWNAIDGYPQTCTFFEQRLFFANTAAYPQSWWGSKNGLYYNFVQGTADDDAVYATVASDQVNPIQFLCSTTSLVALGYGGEFEIRGGVEKPITNTTRQVKLQSEFGAEMVRPEAVGKELLFVERGGKALRSLFPLQVEGYDSGDISVYSEHLFTSGIKFASYERRPESLVWCGTYDGKFHPLTLNSEQKIVAWASGETDGVVEWAATIPQGSADVTYVLVRRTIDGSTKRYIEFFNWAAQRGWHDSRVYQTAFPATATWSGFAHLGGKTVRAHADGIYVGEFVVSVAGQIVLPRTALTLSAGLPYDATVHAQAPEVGTGTGTSQGQAQSTNNVKVRLLDTIGLTCQGHDIPVGNFGPGLLDQAPQPFTGLREIVEIGWDDESMIELKQTQGYPWTVLALIRSFTVNAG